MYRSGFLLWLFSEVVQQPLKTDASDPAEPPAIGWL